MTYLPRYVPASKMVSSNLLTPDEIKAMLAEAGVSDTTRIGQVDFQAFVDQLTDEEEVNNGDTQ